MYLEAGISSEPGLGKRILKSDVKAFDLMCSAAGSHLCELTINFTDVCSNNDLQTCVLKTKPICTWLLPDVCFVKIGGMSD